MKSSKKQTNKSFIKAALVEDDITIPPIVAINTQNAYEAISLLCALAGEIVISHAQADKKLAIKMKHDIIETMDSMFDHIIEEL